MPLALFCKHVFRYSFFQSSNGSNIRVRVRVSLVPKSLLNIEINKLRLTSGKSINCVVIFIRVRVSIPTLTERKDSMNEVSQDLS